jgi:serine/threonine-protein kinase RsbW
MATPDRDETEPAAGDCIRLEIDAALPELAPASAQIRCFLTERGVDASAIYSIEMAIEELATNAIKYAFPSPRKGSITIEAWATRCRAGLLMEDDGEDFDPTEAPVPKIDRSLEEMPIGGLGIHLIRELTDGFAYQRVNNRNQVRVWVLRES